MSKHWHLDYHTDHALLTLDVAGQSANVLSQEVLQELDRHLGELEDKPLKGLIIRSGKASGFIAGADVREFERVADPARATELAQLGQQVCARLAGLPFPSVAVIHGFCLGGGLELALACTYRLAREDTATRLGLPEERLGIDDCPGGNRCASSSCAGSRRACGARRIPTTIPRRGAFSSCGAIAPP